MFVLLTRILLWLIIAILIYAVLLRLLPRSLLAAFGGLVLLALSILAFLNPNYELVSGTGSFFLVPLTPLGISLLLLLISLSLSNKLGIKPSGTVFVGLAFVILLISSLPFISYQLAQVTEREVVSTQLQQRELNRNDPQLPGAIVLLGIGTTEPNLPYRTQIQITDKADRIFYAAELLNQQIRLGNAPLLIVSAGPRTDLTGDEENRIEARDIAVLLRRLGVRDNQIVLETQGVDLRTSAVEVREILAQRRLLDQPIYLVTSAINARRAGLTFNNLGFKTIIRPTDFYTFQSGAEPQRRLGIKDLVPSAQALFLTTEIIKEYLASIYYFLRGWFSPTLT